jgi:hypothetical protein
LRSFTARRPRIRRDAQNLRIADRQKIEELPPPQPKRQIFELLRCVNKAFQRAALGAIFEILGGGAGTLLYPGYGTYYGAELGHLLCSQVFP